MKTIEMMGAVSTSSTRCRRRHRNQKLTGPMMTLKSTRIERYTRAGTPSMPGMRRRKPRVSIEPQSVAPFAGSDHA